MTIDSLPFIKDVPKQAICFPLNDTLLKALRDPNFANQFFADLEKAFGLMEQDKSPPLDEETQALFGLLEHKEFFRASKKNLENVVQQLSEAPPQRLATTILDDKIHIAILPKPITTKTTMHFKPVTGNILVEGIQPVMDWLDTRGLTAENTLVFEGDHIYITRQQLN